MYIVNVDKNDKIINKSTPIFNVSIKGLVRERRSNRFLD